MKSILKKILASISYILFLILCFKKLIYIYIIYIFAEVHTWTNILAS